MSVLMFKIPDRERPRLARLQRLTTPARSALLAALAKCTPTLVHTQLVDEAVAALANVPDLEPKAAREIVNFLMSLYWLRADKNATAEDLASDLKQSAIESGDKTVASPPEGWDEFEKFLAQLLSFDETLGLSAKALFLAYQGQRHYHQGRVITDLRPVFTNDPDMPPARFVILHTLQIEYHENGENREWFATLDTQDLENLRDAAIRALDKESSIEEAMRKSAIPILSWKEPDDVSDDAR